MRLHIDDAELDFLDDGSGTAIALLHGFPLAKEIWDAQTAVLRERARVVRLDLRGLGTSRGGPGPYLMEMLAGDVAGVLDALGIDRAIVVGHSLGVYVTYAFFRMFAERVLGLGLVCGRAEADAEPVAARRSVLADDAERNGIGLVADEYLPRLFAPQTYAERPDVVERVREIVMRTDPYGAAAVLRGMAVRLTAEDLLSEIRVPTRVVAGRADAFVPLDVQRATASKIAGAELDAIDSGHLPQLERPQELTAILAALLDDVKRFGR